MNTYFANLNEQPLNSKLLALIEFAENNKVPIIQEEGLGLLLQLIKIVSAKNILEIGTAIGYSACRMALIDEDIKIDTIERDENMLRLAKQSIEDLLLAKQINLIAGDALLLDDSLFGKYDLIFIDGAKAQYQKFFVKYQKFLNAKGIIVCDNLYFHGLVENPAVMSKNLRSLVEKIKAFNLWLKKNQQFSTVFLSIGDGLSVSVKKEQKL